jgi:hypothetical protein
MSYQREMTADALVIYLTDLFNSISEDVRVNWTEYEKQFGDLKGKEYRVYKDLQEQLPYTPAIEIVEKGSTNSIFSIGTQEEQFKFEIIITTNNNSPEWSSVYNKVIGHLIFDLLNDFNRRSFKVPKTNYCVYYSEATSIDYGYRRGKGLRACRIDWMCKLLKPNRMRDTLA